MLIIHVNMSASTTKYLNMAWYYNAFKANFWTFGLGLGLDLDVL